MEFRDTPDEASWRDQVHTFVGENLPRELAEDFTLGFLTGGSRPKSKRGQGWERSALNTWRKRVVAKGWIAPAWPKEYGGAGLSVKEQFILNEEFAEAGAPSVDPGYFGLTLIIHGTEAQKQRFIPPMLRGETRWAQGFSEPSSGSDLASLQTRAVRDGDDYVINGSKIWTSGAHQADWMHMLARTDPEAPKHRGISYFMLDMHAPGVTVQPLINMPGEHGFNQVFFDNVRVPVANRLGEENRGWYVATTTLDFERSYIGVCVGIRKQLEWYLEYAKQNPTQVTLATRPSLRLEFADRWIDAQTAKLLSYRVIHLQAAGKIPNYEASIAKMFHTELLQRVAVLGMHLVGLHGMRSADFSLDYLTSAAATIAGGTSEVQRNIVATRGLGLPRS